MAGSQAGAWAPLPCFTPSASKRASEGIGWRRDGADEEERKYETGNGNGILVVVVMVCVWGGAGSASRLTGHG